MRFDFDDDFIKLSSNPNVQRSIIQSSSMVRVKSIILSYYHVLIKSLKCEVGLPYLIIYTVLLYQVSNLDISHGMLKKMKVKKVKTTTIK